MVDEIQPVLFRWKVGKYDIIETTETEIGPSGEAVPKTTSAARPGSRIHSGFLAQEIKAAMDGSGVDFSAWGLEDKNDPDSRQRTRPTN